MTLRAHRSPAQTKPAFTSSNRNRTSATTANRGSSRPAPQPARARPPALAVEHDRPHAGERERAGLLRGSAQRRGRHAEEHARTKGAVYSNFKNTEDLFFALIDDRIERQFSIVSEVLASGPHDRAEQLPYMRARFRSGALFADDDWELLHLEFVLYSRRNPAAAEKLADRARHEREFVRELIEAEHANFGVEASFPTDQLAEPPCVVRRALSAPADRSELGHRRHARHRVRLPLRRDGLPPRRRLTELTATRRCRPSARPRSGWPPVMIGWQLPSPTPPPTGSVTRITVSRIWCSRRALSGVEQSAMCSPSTWCSPRHSPWWWPSKPK